MLAPCSTFQMFPLPEKVIYRIFRIINCTFFSTICRQVDFQCEILKIYKVISHVFYTDNYAVALYALLLTYKAI